MDRSKILCGSAFAEENTFEEIDYCLEVLKEATSHAEALCTPIKGKGEKYDISRIFDKICRNRY